MIIMSDPGLQKGFILDTEVVDEGGRQRVEDRSAGCCSSSSLRTGQDSARDHEDRHGHHTRVWFAKELHLVCWKS